MNVCLLCGQSCRRTLHVYNFYKAPHPLCTQCQSQWTATRIAHDEAPRCTRCLKVLAQTDVRCPDCAMLAKHFRPIDQLYCDFAYTSIVKDTLHRYKLQFDVALSDVLARQCRLPNIDYDMVVPIPSPRVRDEARTFNPVCEVLDCMGVAYETVLQSHIRTKQSTLSKASRLQQANPFYITEAEKVHHRHILLVDDIYTTGLTVHHAAELLFTRKIRKISVFTFSR